MSYSEFVATLINGVNMFYNGIVTIANVLINNYFIITILGLSIFTSLFSIFINDILSLPFTRKNNDLDNVRSDK